LQSTELTHEHFAYDLRGLLRRLTEVDGKSRTVPDVLYHDIFNTVEQYYGRDTALFPELAYQLRGAKASLDKMRELVDGWIRQPPAMA